MMTRYEHLPAVCPLTATQLGIYLDSIGQPDSVKYSTANRVDLPADTDPARFTAAIKQAAALHPAFFVTIGVQDGVPSMILHEGEAAVEEITVDDAEEAARAFIRPFDLESGPLYRFQLVHSPKGLSFFFDVHHLIFDGTSVRLLAEQILACYEGKPREPESMTLFDAVRAEQEPKDPEKIRQYTEFFRERLDGVEADCRPTGDRVEAEAPTGAGQLTVHFGDRVRYEETAAFTKAAGITENSLFMGAFGYTLAKWNGATESYFNTYHTGRTDRQLADAVGFFVRTLPAVCRFREEDAPLTLLKTVFDDYYFEKKNDCISYTSLASEYGLNMDVSFVFHGDLFNALSFGESSVTCELIPVPETVSSLEMMIMRTVTGYDMVMRYDRSLYTEGLIRDFCDMYVSVIRGMMTAETLGEIELADENAKKRIAEFNRTEKPYDTKKTAVDLFREQAALRPEADCVVCEDRHYSYGETDALTDRLAAALRRRGIVRGSIVGILIPRSEYMPICALGVLKAGAAYLPLDPTYPPERLNLMMSDSGASLLISTPELQGIISEDFTGPRIMTEEIPGLPDFAEVLPSPLPEDPFVILYTSGSTGIPKGVIFAHSNIMVTAAWERDFFELGPGSRNTSYASFGFDAHAYDLYPTLTSGAALYIITEDIRLDLPALQKYFNDNGITHTTMTTQVARQFALMKGFKTLRHITAGGEKLTPLPPPEGFKFNNAYGPTEGSILASCFQLDGLYRDVPIGKPLDNVKIYITDPIGRLLPPGAAGELLISGAHVTQGYLNRPEKTAEAYGTNPFCSDPGYERIYHTGDIVRYMHDGTLQFIGRRDAQVKVRGFRVELTEIEEVIRRFDGIRDATVAAFDDPAGGKFVAAYVVSDSPVDTEALNAFIRAAKPPYMVPAVTMQIDKIPMTQNQKVNKRVLPLPERKAENIVPPENETQRQIFDTVSEVLGHDAFGVDTDLFEAGLTSIATLKLNVALADKFGVSLKLDDLKNNGTIRKLEALLSVTGQTESWEMREDYPVSQTQQGIFIECSMQPGSVTYNMPLLIRLGGGIDTDRLLQAIRDAVNAHPYLKTTFFADESGELRARRNDSADPVVDRVDCPCPPAGEELVRPFDLLKDRLYRITLFRTPEENRLFMDFHHIISDGTSEGILLRDIDRAYRGETLARETYTGFEAALEEEKLRSGDRLAQAKAYYDSIFSGCETDCLPPRCPETKEAGAASRHLVCETDAAKVNAFCEKNKLTPNAFFNAVFGFVLSRYTQHPDVVFTTVWHGRSDSRLASAVTMLVKTLPVLVRTEGQNKVADLIRETREQLMNSMSNDLYSFAEISHAYGIRSDILFVYQGDNFAFDTLCGEKAGFDTVLPPVAKAPLALTVNVVDGKFELDCEYRTDLFRAELAESLLGSLDKVISGFLTSEDLRSVSLLTAEADRQLAEINDTFRPFENIPVHRMVERHAAADPDRPAVIRGEKRLTYGELNRSANRVAHGLIALGVKKDSIVGMLLERDVEISLSELGILKAGGAFLGLLPAYPDDRLAYCLTDAESPVIITTEALKAARGELCGPDHPWRTVTLEELLAPKASDPETDESNPDLPVPPDSLAYCIYTSGSTGNPKGVMIEHHNLVSFVQTEGTYDAYYRGEHGRVGIALASVTFDMSVFDNLCQLMCGQTVVIATDHEIHNPGEFARLITENGADMLAGTPSLLTNYLGIPEFREAMKGMKTVIAGAEVFPGKLYNDLRELAPSAVIINGYGPTECTITCCGKVLTSPEGITIGGPLTNTAFYIVDRFGNILPPYACGELIICGEQVGRGYVKLPEKTAAAFYTLRGLPAYHSGDTARLNKDGEVEFFGRIDNQVKLRGFRVELDEIEKTICAFPGVLQSKVLVRRAGDTDTLNAYFTADRPVDLAALTDHLKGKLTYYMVPDAMMQLETMPLTPSGKIDKKALPEIRREAKKGPRRAPKKSTEQELCDLFASILSLPEYYADDDFFEQGGTSLTASKLTMQLMSKGIRVEYQDIFDHPTPESLADYIDSLRRGGAATDEKRESGEDDWMQALLSHNTLTHAAEVTREPLGNVLLTGATGFLGIHLFRELLDKNEGKILCLLRRGDAPDPTERLRNLLMYYFGSTFESELRDRVTIIEGDVTDAQLAEKLKDFSFDTIINSAAIVKHYAADDSIERINVGGVENLIGIAKARNAKLIQISTVSVPGVHTGETYAIQKKMHEHELFVIDNMDNKYIISKYHAEVKMLEAIRDGLRGKIIRVGNLMGRHSDGEFQINFNTNAFLHALQGFATIGKCPISHSTDPMGYSPIDLTARAIVLLAGTNDQFTAFHADNRFGFDEMQLIEACNRCGIRITPVADEEYYADYYRMLGDDRINGRLSGLVTNDRPDLHMVETDNIFTANVLYRLGFAWPLIDIPYLERTIQSLMTLGFFDPDD